MTLWNPFSHHDVVDVEKRLVWPKFWFWHSCFFHSWWSWSFPVHRVPLGFNWVLEYLSFIASDDVFHQFGLFITSQENLSRSVDIRDVKFFAQFLYRHLLFQQSSKGSYDDLHAQFHWFWSLFVGLRHKQVNLDIGHLQCSLGLQKTVILFENTHTR